MTRYLLHKQVEKEKWDDCINQAPQGNIYGYSWYLDHVCPGWDALVNDDYSVVMPVAKRKKYLIDYIYPPSFSQQLGVYSMKEVSREDCFSFLSAIPYNFRYIEMQLSVSNQWVPGSFKVKQLPDYILNLNRSYQSIRKGFSSNHERNIRKASGNELSIFRHASVDDIIKMFRENRGRSIANLRDSHYEVFRALANDALTRKMAKIWMVNDKFGLPCAGAVFFLSHKRAYFIFSAITKKGRDLSAMHFLVNEFIYVSAEYLEALDFEGSVNPDLARFYKGFGSQEFIYLQIKKNHLPPPWSWFKS